MLRHLLSGAWWAFLGYLLGAAISWALIKAVSTNRHDQSVEAVMTALFAGGPALAVVGFIYGVVKSVRHP